MGALRVVDHSYCYRADNGLLHHSHDLWSSHQALPMNPFISITYSVQRTSNQVDSLQNTHIALLHADGLTTSLFVSSTCTINQRFYQSHQSTIHSHQLTLLPPLSQQLLFDITNPLPFLDGPNLASPIAHARATRAVNNTTQFSRGSHIRYWLLCPNVLLRRSSTILRSGYCLDLDLMSR
jgi:hypothetical protein